MGKNSIPAQWRFQPWRLALVEACFWLASFPCIKGWVCLARYSVLLQTTCNTLAVQKWITTQLLHCCLEPELTIFES